VKAGLEKDKAALLIIIGALTNGKKVFLACESGYRENRGHRVKSSLLTNGEMGLDLLI
jgi:hypothetical protein